MIDDEALKSLERLHQMKNDGVITESDFESAKQNILAGRARPTARAAIQQNEVGIPNETDHLGWMLLPLRKYADFKGRSSRKEFWMFLLGVNLVIAALAIIGVADTDYGETGAIGNLAFALMVITFLGVLVPLIAVQVRRFHDQDKSGMLALINLIPYLGSLVVLAFMLVEGTAGENQYGPDPRQA